MPARWKIAILALVLLSAPWSSGSAQTREEVLGAAIAVTGDDEVQTRLPSELRPPDEARGEHIVVLPERPLPEATTLPADQKWGTILIFLAWMCAIAAVIVIIGAFLELLPGQRRNPFATTVGGDERDVALAFGGGATDQMLSDADQLAASGQYAEAMHRLLLDAVALLARMSGQSISDSLTSREVLRVLPVDSHQHGMLREIVRRVEETWFGRRGAANEDYAAVRTLFTQFQAGRIGELR